jgi:hypothetical protein
MAPIDYLFGDANAFNKETLDTATDFLINPFGENDSTASVAANVILNPVGAIAGLFCFVAGTVMQMTDGMGCAVEDIDIRDNMAEGGMVLACGKALVTELYCYNGVKLDGKHAVFEDGRWLRVQDSIYADRLLCNTVVYPIVNENHLIIVNGMVFADMVETPLGWDVTEDERLEWLNAQHERNATLRRKYADI